MARRPDPWLKAFFLVVGTGLILAGAFVGFVGEGIRSAATYPTQYVLQLTAAAGLPLVVGIGLVWASLRIPFK